MNDSRSPIELIGARTGNCLRVAIAFEEAGLPYRVRRLDLRQGEQRSTAHLALNPAGKVPTIVDRSAGGELVLSQSNAILLYAADRRPGLLLPLEATERAIALERFFYFLTDAIAVSHAAFFLRSTGDREASVALDARSIAAIQDADRFAENSPFMAGEHFSLADIAAFTIGAASKRHIDWEVAPSLKRWFREIEQRPSIQRGMTAFDPSDS